MASPNSSLALVELPALPPKRLTRSLAAEFVEKRKIELQEYLREILLSPALRHNEIILKFLEVPDSVRPMLSRAGIADDAGDGKDRGGDAGHQQAMGDHHRAYEERRVLELLNALASHKNK